MDYLISQLAPKKFVQAITNDEEKNLNYKKIPLCNTIKKPVKSQIARKVMGAKERKKLKLLELKESEKKYALYIPLHNLWQDYMSNLLEGCEEEKEVERRVSKADLHGCRLKVVRSKCPSLVGIEGINLIETKNIFTIITPSNQVKRVPKINTTFSFSIDGTQILICGTNFRFKASERSVRNFKVKPLIEVRGFKKPGE